MSMYHRDAAKCGYCRQCSRSIQIGDRIHVAKSRYTTTTRCVTCRPEPTRTAWVDGSTTAGPATPASIVDAPMTTTGPDAIAAAEQILRDAPAHLRNSLDAIRCSVSTLGYLGCPREAISAAVLLGREDGARDLRATLATDAPGAIAAMLDAPVDLGVSEARRCDDEASAQSYAVDSFADLLSIPEPTDMERTIATVQTAAKPLTMAERIDAALAADRTLLVRPTAPDAPAVAQNGPVQPGQSLPAPSARFRRVAAVTRAVRAPTAIASATDAPPWQS